MIATASCRSPHRCELHHPARLQRSNPHRACRAITAHHARFPPLEAFGRRPHEYAAPPIMRPASETLHTSGSASRSYSFGHSCQPQTLSEPFIVGPPSRIVCHRQLLCLKLADGSALGAAVREIGLDRFACFSLLPA